MSRGLQTNIVKSRSIPFPTYYVTALLTEYSQWAFDEERCLDFKGRWRELVFEAPLERPLDLEIGTGIGQHFAYRAHILSERSLLGIELKYKPLIQSIRRALRGGATNARMIRYNAVNVSDLFAPGELNDIFIHFPDPWEKKRGTEKHRLFQREFLNTLFALQRPGSFIDFKTDSQSYFEFATEKARASLYQVERFTEDLHNSTWASENFMTPFEEYFTKENLRIGYFRLRK